ncbi:MAG TPA: FUSC family protein, partial [Streptosporangiaceae bacterium]
MRLPRTSDAGLASLRSAARAAIVMPAVFAIGSQLIGQPQTAIFAPFGAFAMLVLADFSGPPRSRFTAYLTLGLTGAVLVVLGTLCSRDPWLAAAAMAVTGFVILFCGIFNGYIAAGGTAAILAFVLPVAIPAPPSMIGWRLAGWGLAASAALAAVMLLWPPRRKGTLRGDAALACAALADLAGSAARQGGRASAGTAAAARSAITRLRGALAASSHRPTGPTGQAAALAALVEELGWLLGSLTAAAALPAGELCRAEHGESMAATAALLRASGAALAGQDARPDTGRVDRAQKAMVKALARQISELPPGPDDQTIETLLDRLFRARAISYTARQIAGYALAACGIRTARRPGWRAGAAALRRFAAEHADASSVWLHNSIRGAAGLAIAVFIAQQAGLQHSFWVVLGTLSVLRSNALGTGRSVLSALAGTAAGIVIGAAVLLAVGDAAPVLWGLLPVAVLVATYAPRVISFAAGQAAFTVVLLILFNIIQPTGWTVGLIRIEDVAIGFAVSLGVGVVFWPRGAAAVLRRSLAAAYARGADYVAVSAELLTGAVPPGPAGQATGPAQAEQAASAAIHRLDDAYRQYLAEHSAKRADPESAARLVAGPTRLIRAGHSMAALTGPLASAGAAAPDGQDGAGPAGPDAAAAAGYHGRLDGQVLAV